MTIKFGDFKRTRDAITLIACIGMRWHVLCPIILYKCGVLFICSRVTPNAYRQINERLHTFSFLKPQGSLRRKSHIWTIKLMSRLRLRSTKLSWSKALRELVVATLTHGDHQELEKKNLTNPQLFTHFLPIQKSNQS